jgi:hypothetical protein
MTIQYCKKKLIITILWSGLLVGTLDILIACVNFYIQTNNNPRRIFLYIASSVFGKEAYAGESMMIVWGFLFHFTIAYSFTVCLFLIYPRIFKGLNKIVAGILYGTFIWMVMNFLILPMTKVSLAKQFNPVQSITGMLILIIAVGIPLAVIASNYFNKLKMDTSF